MAIYFVDSPFDGELPDDATLAVDAEGETIWRRQEDSSWSEPIDFSAKTLRHRQKAFLARLKITPLAESF